MLAQAIETTYTLSALAVTLLVSLVIPVLTGLVTKATLSTSVKGFITFVLNGVAAIVVTATVADGTAVWSEESLIAALIGFAISVATYAGIYKKAGITSNHGGRLAPGKGLGPGS